MSWNLKENTVIKGTDIYENGIPHTNRSIVNRLNLYEIEIDKLNDTMNDNAFELYKEGIVSFGKAVELSNMDYQEFMIYCNDRGFGLELQE